MLPGDRRRVRRLLPLLCALVAAAAAPAAAQPRAATTVIVVRHAERADDGTERDPELSEAGRGRAAALADALADAGVGAIVVTQYRRTQQTAAPLAERLGVEPVQVAVETGGLDAHVAALGARLAGDLRGRTVLVVGHNNTVPAIAAALSGTAVPPMPSAEYATMYIITLPAEGSPAFVRARYGAPDTTDGRME